MQREQKARIRSSTVCAPEAICGKCYCWWWDSYSQNSLRNCVCLCVSVCKKSEAKWNTSSVWSKCLGTGSWALEIRHDVAIRHQHLLGTPASIYSQRMKDPESMWLSFTAKVKQETWGRKLQDRAAEDGMLGEENMETLYHTMPNGVRRLLTASSVSPCHGHKQQKWCSLSHDLSQRAALVISPVNGMAFGLQTAREHKILQPELKGESSSRCNTSIKIQPPFSVTSQKWVSNKKRARAIFIHPQKHISTRVDSLWIWTGHKNDKVETTNNMAV